MKTAVIIAICVALVVGIICGTIQEVRKQKIKK